MKQKQSKQQALHGDKVHSSAHCPARPSLPRFEEEVSKKWGSADGAPGRIRLNVGGQVFETSPSTLTKDRFSLLAAIVTQPPPATSSAPAPAPAPAEEGAAESKTPAAEPAREAGDAAPADSGRSLHGGGGSHFARNASGTVFIDRDWWVFRHILAFLRHDSLPSNLALLRQLYIESAYYRLHSLRTAIERKLAADDVPGEALAVEEAGALPGPHAGFALGATPAGGDYTDTGVREAVERRAQDTLSWATHGHGTSRAKPPVDPGRQTAVLAPPAAASLAGSLGGVRNMAALLASDELDGGWGPRVPGWDALPQEEVDALAGELVAAEQERHGRRSRHGRRHRRPSRGSDASSAAHGRRGGAWRGRGRSWSDAGSEADGSMADSGRSGDSGDTGYGFAGVRGATYVPGVVLMRGTEDRRWGHVEPPPHASVSSRQYNTMTLDAKAKATALPDPFGFWGRR